MARIALELMQSTSNVTCKPFRIRQKWKAIRKALIRGRSCFFRLLRGTDSTREQSAPCALSLILQLYFAEWGENEQRPGPKGPVNSTSFRGLKPPAPSVIFDLQLLLFACRRGGNGGFVRQVLVVEDGVEDQGIRPDGFAAVYGVVAE